MNKKHRILNYEIKQLINNSKFSVRYSILSLLFFISSCSAPYKNLTKTEYTANEIKKIPYSLPYLENALIYKTNINFYKNDISGLLIIKKTDKEVYRIALTTQFGLKIFDFELEHVILNVKYCVEYLNKKIIIKTFQNDFSLLLMQNKFEKIYFVKDAIQHLDIWQLNSGRFYYNYIKNEETENINNIIYTKYNSKKISVGLYNYQDNIPGSIVIEHHNIKLKMNLKLIQ